MNEILGWVPIVAVVVICAYLLVAGVKDWENADRG